MLMAMVFEATALIWNFWGRDGPRVMIASVSCMSESLRESFKAFKTCISLSQCYWCVPYFSHVPDENPRSLNFPLSFLFFRNAQFLKRHILFLSFHIPHVTTQREFPLVIQRPQGVNLTTPSLGLRWPTYFL